MSLADLIADFVQRQYVAEIGDVRDNVESLFAEDLVYHSGRETLGREDLVDMGVWVRAIPGRTFSLTDLLVDGLTVRWRMSADLPGMAPDGTDVRQTSEHTARFNDAGLVSEVWSKEVAPRMPE